jgi:hypothetical protein
MWIDTGETLNVSRIFRSQIKIVHNKADKVNVELSRFCVGLRRYNSTFGQSFGSQSSTMELDKCCLHSYTLENWIELVLGGDEFLSYLI